MFFNIRTNIFLALVSVVACVPFFAFAFTVPFSRPVDTKVFCGGPDAYQKNLQFLRDRSDKPSSVDTGVNPDFACNLRRFIEASGDKIRIEVMRYEVTKSAAAGDDCSLYQCKEGTNSHPRGFAADLSYGGESMHPSAQSIGKCQRNRVCQWAHANAANFNLQYRLMPGSPCYPGKPETWHVELRGIGCDAAGGGMGGGLFAGLGSLLRSALGTVPQQPLPAQEPTQHMQLTTSAPVTSSSSVSIDGLFGSTQPINLTSYNSSSSAADRLAELAFGTSSMSGRTTTSVPIIVSSTNAAYLIGIQGRNTQSGSQGSGIQSPSQQTFTSPDLSWNMQTSANSISGWGAVLVHLKALLIRIRDALIPFNNTGNTQYMQ